MPSDTEIGGRNGNFPETAWSIIGAEPDPAQRQIALDKLVRRYWKPVFLFIRHTWGAGVEDSKDLTQDFFRHVIENCFLEHYVRDRGSFRSFLKVAVGNFVRDTYKSAMRAKRGGGRTLAPEEPAEIPEPEPATADDVFEQEWRKAVLERSLEICEERLTSNGFAASFQVFKRYELAPERSQMSYKSVADEMAMTTVAVKTHLDRAREVFRMAVIEAVREISGSDNSAAEEISRLFGP